MITFKQKGSFKNIERFLDKMQKKEFFQRLNQYGRRGVDALSAATPIDSGKTASSWNYEIHRSKELVEIVWTNSNVVDGVPIVILLQYGHATGNGGYVQGYDFINPAIRPIFDEIEKDLWKEVTSS